MKEVKYLSNILQMSNIFEQSNMNPTFIFVDGSYYCFYRFYALINWWKNAFPEEPLEEPFENEIFLEKFKKIFGAFFALNTIHYQSKSDCYDCEITKSHS